MKYINKKRIILVVICLVLGITGAYLWKILNPNQIKDVCTSYLQQNLSPFSDNEFEIYGVKPWKQGKAVAVQSDEMIGIVYLERKYGVYYVKNHALFSIQEPGGFVELLNSSLEYEYQLLKVKDFVNEKDIILAYVNHNKIEELVIDDKVDNTNFNMSLNYSLVLSEVENTSKIVTYSPEKDLRIYHWNDESLERICKYDCKDFVHSSEVPLLIGITDGVSFITDDSIAVEFIDLKDIQSYNSEKYDAIFIDLKNTTKDFDQKTFDYLKETGWQMYIINPLENPTLFSSSIDDKVQIVGILEDSKSFYSRTKEYEFESDYHFKYKLIFDRLSSVGQKQN